jgi:hypothetical protein
MGTAGTEAHQLSPGKRQGAASGRIELGAGERSSLSGPNHGGTGNLGGPPRGLEF